MCNETLVQSGTPLTHCGSGIYTMYGMSEPAVGYAKSISFSDDAVAPVRIAMAKRLITSSA